MDEDVFSIWADGATPEQREAIYAAAMDAAWAASEDMGGVSVGGVGALNPKPRVVMSCQHDGGSLRPMRHVQGAWACDHQAEQGAASGTRP